MANKPCEFVKHHLFKNSFVTDIWFNPNVVPGKYVSVLSDMAGLKFDSIEEAEAWLDKTMEDMTNG
jgi:hypothetical protein